MAHKNRMKAARDNNLSEPKPDKMNNWMTPIAKCNANGHLIWGPDWIVLGKNYKVMLNTME